MTLRRLRGVGVALLATSGVVCALAAPVSAQESHHAHQRWAVSWGFDLGGKSSTTNDLEASLRQAGLTQSFGGCLLCPPDFPYTKGGGRMNLSGRYWPNRWLQLRATCTWNPSDDQTLGLNVDAYLTLSRNETACGALASLGGGSYWIGAGPMIEWLRISETDPGPTRDLVSGPRPGVMLGGEITGGLGPTIFLSLGLDVRIATAYNMPTFSTGPVVVANQRIVPIEGALVFSLGLQGH